ncbi:Uma2 family endonuclease [Methylorubrum rhodinum]|uniref:Uma2 family endonuclease n=1 Tax=Methylorubrum rhodinum TaxID=29428 RepID=A0A840ZMH3_9HYPH|nr:Uma2 family endonuclease [Methylorubrum rhodinum]MBB5759372.1 Uma2 family endonuclease [Methylorubrum rhodinum]
MERELDRAMSEEQFLAWAEGRDGRYELVEGRVTMQAGATRDHERVAKRIFSLLYAQVDEARFDVNKGDFGVRIRPGEGRGSILYPDVVIDAQSPTGAERATLTPVVVIEVLSAGTDDDHHVQKFARDARRDTLRCYAVFDQKRPRTHLWTWGDGGRPDAPALVEGSAAEIVFPVIGARLRLADIYRPIPG